MALRGPKRPVQTPDNCRVIEVQLRPGPGPSDLAGAQTAAGVRLHPGQHRPRLRPVVCGAARLRASAVSSRTRRPVERAGSHCPRAPALRASVTTAACSRSSRERRVRARRPPRPTAPHQVLARSRAARRVVVDGDPAGQLALVARFDLGNMLTRELGRCLHRSWQRLRAPTTPGGAAVRPTPSLARTGRRSVSAVHGRPGAAFGWRIAAASAARKAPWPRTRRSPPAPSPC